MALINQADDHANWFEVLEIWEKIANWIHYQTPESQLRSQIKAMLVFLWNEKDWLIGQYPTKHDKIEQRIKNSVYMGVVGDLANTVKHRHLTRKPRSSANQTDYFGKVTVSRGIGRRLYYVKLGNKRHVEIMNILRGALDEFEELRGSLLSGLL